MAIKGYLSTFVKALHGCDEWYVLDTETSGFQDMGEVVQIGILNNQGDVMLDTLVKPVNAIPKAAQKVHGISSEMVKDAPTWWDIAADVARIISDKPLVAYGVNFDRQILFNSSRYQEMNYPNWREITTWHCCMNAFAPHYGEWNNRYRRYTWKPLSVAAASFGIQVQDAHSAIGDCCMTLRVTQALLARYSGEVK